MKSSILLALLAGMFPAPPAGGTEPGSLEEIVVTASLRPTSVAELPQSVTVLEKQDLRSAGVQHFEDVLGLVPGLNWAAGTSRPRFFQLRGIGEVEQYQGAPNPSVGFLIDDIDFSGVGMPATLFDVSEIQVLRGPQGTSYGANALAGLISVRTADPGQAFELHAEATGGTYDTRAAGIAIGDGFGQGQSGWRLVAQQYLSNGFRHNAFYDMNSTNGFDEGTLRGKLRWDLGTDWQADLTLMRVNIDNGYDAWSINNTRTTWSNQPGRDAQRSNGIALRLTGRIEGLGELRSITSAAGSDILYSFDGDWGNDRLWGPYAPYDYFQRDSRYRHSFAQDLRFIPDPGRALFGRVDWLLGAYALRLTESDRLLYQFDDTYNGAGSSTLESRYAATNLALYGSLEMPLTARSRVSAGMRIERRDAAYRDSADEATPFPSQLNGMLGGNLSWQYQAGEGRHVYATVARGYKGGGFNIGAQILSEQRSFGPESLYSAELGIKLQGLPSWQLQADAFYMRRRNMQVYLSEQLQQSNPLAYVFFTQNAADGENLGLESEMRYRLDHRWNLAGSATLLRTRYLAVGGNFSELGIGGRAQPFAPAYKLSGSLEYGDAEGWFARIDSHALGSFYYYTSDAQSSRSYHLEEVRLGYRRAGWAASVWIRNLFDAHYAQQGFFFGLIPPDFPNQSFLQQGDPRQAGITVRYDLGP